MFSACQLSSDTSKMVLFYLNNVGFCGEQGEAEGRERAARGQWCDRHSFHAMKELHINVMSWQMYN